jgi:histidinol phosphatase-like enzyme
MPNRNSNIAAWASFARRLDAVTYFPVVIPDMTQTMETIACRKPKPGMLLKSAQDHRIDLAQSYLVGDRWRDVEAGRTAGCRTIFIDYGYPQDQRATPDKVMKSLAAAAEFILSREVSP